MRRRGSAAGSQNAGWLGGRAGCTHGAAMVRTPASPPVTASAHRAPKRRCACWAHLETIEREPPLGELRVQLVNLHALEIHGRQQLAARADRVYDNRRRQSRDGGLELVSSGAVDRGDRGRRRSSRWLVVRSGTRTRPGEYVEPLRSEFDEDWTIVSIVCWRMVATTARATRVLADRA